MENEKELLNKIQEEVKSIISEASKETVKKADIDKALDSVNEKIKSLTDEGRKELNGLVEKQNLEINQLKNAMKEQGIEMAKMKDGNPKEQPMTFKEAIKNAILEYKDQVLTNKNDGFGERLSMRDFFEKGNNKSPKFEVKAAVDMLGANILGNQVPLLRLTELDPNRVGIPLTVYPHVLNVFPQKAIARPTMSLLVVHTYWDGSGVKAEGDASGKSSFLFKTVEFKAFNIATYFSLSDETLDDLNETLDEISVVAPDKILDKIDGKIFADAGDGSTDIMGLFVGGTTCTDFVASTYATSVEGANLVDLIEKMKLAIRKNKYRANFVGLNSTDISNIQSLKDQLDNSITDRRLVFSANGELVRICGLTVVENDSITANTCIVGDTNQAIIGVRKGMEMMIDTNGTDFVEGQKTVRLGVRLAFGVRDKAAFQYSSAMETDLTTITKTGA